MPQKITPFLMMPSRTWKRISDRASISMTV